MQLERFRLASDFLEDVRDYLEAREAENNLILGFLEVFVEDNGDSSTAYMAKIVDENETCKGVALYQQRNLLLSCGLDVSGLELVADSLEREGISIPGVVAPSMIAQAFAKRWAARTSQECFLAMDQRIYRLNQVEALPPGPGEMRPIRKGDEELVAKWLFEFGAEAVPHESTTLEKCLDNAHKRIQVGGTFVWVVEGRPVSMAALSRATRHGVCVNAVYTPLEQRKRGHATALVAALSQHALRDLGKQFCVLYTDLQNPTSNAIYQKIGYRPILDSQNYRFR